MGGQQAVTAFSRPGVVDGSIERVNIGSWIGESVVIVVFYPANFGPQSGQSAALLRAVAAVTTDTDARAVGVAPESVYSHRRFADEAGVDVALVSDADAEVAAAYDVATTGAAGQPLAEPSLFVLDYRGEVVHEWRAEHEADMPEFQRLQSQLRSITPDRSAEGCYRIGYAQYREGRRNLSSGLEHCKAGNWDLACSAFSAACGEFSDAVDTFTTGQRLAADDGIGDRNSRGRVTATTYWEAAEWLAGFATAADRGEDQARSENRRAAEAALRGVRDETLPEPDSGAASTADGATA